MAQDIQEKIDGMVTPTIEVSPGPIIPDPTSWNVEADTINLTLPSGTDSPQPTLTDVEQESEAAQETSFIDEPTQIARVKLPNFLKPEVGSKAQQTKEIKKRLKESQKIKEKKAKVAKKDPKKVYNLDTIADEDTLAEWMEAGAQMDNLSDFKRISYKDIAAKYNTPEVIVMEEGVVVHTSQTQKGADAWIKKSQSSAKKENKNAPIYTTAEQTAYSQKWIDNFLDPKNLAKRKTVADPYEVFKQFHFLTTISKKAYTKAEEIVKIIETKGSGSVTNEMRLEFQQAVVLEGILSKKLKGAQVDLARSLGILSEARKAGSVSFARQSDEAIEAFGGPKSIDNFAKNYVKKSAEDRHKMAEVLSYPWYRKVANIIPTTYINDLIAGIPTSVRNVLGFVSLNNFTKIENFTTVGVGHIRHGLAKSTGMAYKEERMVLEEAVAMMSSSTATWRDAWSRFWITLKTNKPKDASIKFDTQTRTSFNDPFKYDIGYGAGRAIEYLGMYTTVSGRLLSSQDEFMKGIAFGHKIIGLATRQKVAKRTQLISEGVDPKIADELSEKLFDDLLAQPTQEMVEEGIEYARYATQTTPLSPGILRNIEKSFNNPGLKLFTVFMRVTSNIIGSASERNLLTAAFTPRVYKNLMAGGVKRDQAIARLATGSTFIYTMQQLTLDGHLTGAGPYNYADKQTLIAAGWQPYSFVFAAGKLSKEQIAALQTITNVSITESKVYVSYQGIEPLSILMAQGATMAEYSQLYPNDDELMGMAVYAVAGAAEYVGEHPLLSGMGKIVNVFDQEINGDYLYSLIQEASEQYSDYVVKGIPSPVGVPVDIGKGKNKKVFVGPSLGGFWRNMEKMNQPTRSATGQPVEMESAELLGTPEEKIAAAANRGFEKAMRNACSANSLCSGELPDELDGITGKPIRNGLGNLYDLWSPFKLGDGKQNMAKMVLAEYGANDPVPSAVKSAYGVIDGVRLSQKQLNELKYYATEDGKLEQSIVSLGKSLLNVNLPKADKAKLMNQVISEYYSAAKAKLLANNDDLRLKIEEVKMALNKEQNETQSLNTLMKDKTN